MIESAVYSVATFAAVKNVRIINDAADDHLYFDSEQQFCCDHYLVNVHADGPYDELDRLCSSLSRVMPPFKRVEKVRAQTMRATAPLSRIVVASF
jgi:hypothetical protein